MLEMNIRICVIIIINQDDGTERRIPPPIPQEHFGQRVFVKCLHLK